ncbi:MAG: PorT family protein [Cyclobacteriaceae bacterium]|nr:PorT family protein [Cyclobacteriaceae bacterium]UYN85853.1 MAG: PorT family protein [Cyclobacteriaceae bacterium]
MKAAFLLSLSICLYSKHACTAQLAQKNTQRLVYSYLASGKETPTLFGKEKPSKAFTNQFDVDLFAGAASGQVSIQSNTIDDVSGSISPMAAIEVSLRKSGFGFQTGLSFWRYNFDVKTISADGRRLQLNYLEMPLMARYSFASGLYFNAGLSTSFNIGSTADFDFGTGRPNQENRMNKAELIDAIASGGKITAGYRFPKGLNIQAFYFKAIKEILKDGSDGKTFASGGIMIGYKITKR